MTMSPEEEPRNYNYLHSLKDINRKAKTNSKVSERETRRKMEKFSWRYLLKI